MNQVRRQNFLKEIAEAIEKGDSAVLEAAILEAHDLCFNEVSLERDTFPEAVFDQLVLLMSRKEFFEMDGSHNLLLVFESEWGCLTDPQKEKLLEFIKSSYDKFKDWMSHFIISELLGEYYCNEASFRVLTELQMTPNETARSLIPHGYEHIAREAASAKLRQMALSRLDSMKQDESLQVREEVAESLAKIQRYH